MKKTFLYACLAIFGVITLIMGGLYWSDKKAKSLYEDTRWIVENTKQLKDEANNSDAEAVSDHFFHLYVDAAVGRIEKNKIRTLIDNLCYELNRNCAEVNLVIANLFLSKLRVNDEKSIISARNSLRMAEKFYTENLEHSPIAYETTSLLYEMFMIRNSGNIENKSRELIKKIKSDKYLSNFDFSSHTKFSEFHSEICDLRLAIVAKLLAFSGEKDNAVYLFFQLDEKLQKFK